MHDNTMTHRNGRQPVIGGKATFKWNLCMMLMLAMLACPMLSAADEAQPFDCTMPIILKPLMRHLHQAIWPLEGEFDKRSFLQGKPTKVVFEISSRPASNEEKKLFDKIIELSYKDPANRFVIYVKDGLAVKIEHIDELGKSHTYHQTLPNRLQKMDFKNKKYLDKSRELVLSVYKWEFPLMNWNTGRYEALVNSSFTSDKPDMATGNAAVEITFESPRLECKFSFIMGKLYNACYIHHNNKKLPYLATYYTFVYGAKGNLVSGKNLDESAKKAKEMLFYEDLGVNMEADFQGNQYKTITFWKKEGEENTCLTHAEWQKLGRPMDYDEWKAKSDAK